MSLLTKEFKKNMTYPIELFDKNENRIYYEDGAFYWYLKEYDSNNNLIYYEDIGGDWYKREYDTNNNPIYYEDSNGLIIDNRPKKELTIKQIEEMLGIKNIKIIKEQENEH
jgi:hypothetical protein